MALSSDFLRQAHDLATRRGRPSQINLRRAVSAAYYALFHLLIEETVERMVPCRTPGLRSRASRSMQHGEMMQICKTFRNATPPESLKDLLGPRLSPELREIADAFIDLQDERHAADYEVSLKLSHLAVSDTLAQADAAFLQWRAIRNSAEANVFLAALVFGKRWSR